MFRTIRIPFLLLPVLLNGCAGMSVQPLPPAEVIDLDRFMGRWFVLAHIPTVLETSAFNAIEHYELADDGTVTTTFTFNKGGYDGELKRYALRGFIRDRRTNAIWGMQFVWPFKADYRVAYIDDEYTETIIARQKRDYVWIMARNANVSDADYERLIARAEAMGYQRERIRRVPHARTAAAKY